MSLISEPKALHIGDEAPNFTADTTEGMINFYDYVGNSWCLFFSHPKDFTPVCTTELGRASKLKKEFDNRNCCLIALSIDDLRSHNDWINDINSTQGTRLNFPIISDPHANIAHLYGMIHPHSSNHFTVRSVFVVDPKKKVRLIMTYPLSTGRNFDELLRVLDSMQLTDKYGVSTPANWNRGEPCLISPEIKDPDVLKEKFPKGWEEITPYMRITPSPE